MSVKITIERQIERRGVFDDRNDQELACTYDCQRHSEYFGEYPSGGRQTWIDAELVGIELDGREVEDDKALAKLLDYPVDDLLDSMQTEAVESYEAGE